MLGFFSWMFDRQVAPRGIGWAILPILGAISGWRLGWTIPDHVDSISQAGRWILDHRIGRAFLAVSGVWLVAWSAYVTTHEDFAYNFFDESIYGDWGYNQWGTFVGGAFGGPIVFAVVLLAIRWIQNGE